jgi:hypothetical protein
MVCVEDVRARMRAVVAVCGLVAMSGACRTQANGAPPPGQEGVRAKGEEGSMGNPAASADKSLASFGSIGVQPAQGAGSLLRRPI